MQLFVGPSAAPSCQKPAAPDAWQLAAPPAADLLPAVAVGATEQTHSAGAVALASVVAVTATALAAVAHFADARQLGTVAVPGKQRVVGLAARAVVHALLHGVAVGGVWEDLRTPGRPAVARRPLLWLLRRPLFAGQLSKKTNLG